MYKMYKECYSIKDKCITCQLEISKNRFSGYEVDDVEEEVRMVKMSL